MKISTFYFYFYAWLLLTKLIVTDHFQYRDVQLESSMQEENEGEDFASNKFVRAYNYGTCTCTSLNWINPYTLQSNSNSVYSSVCAVNGLTTYFSTNYFYDEDLVPIPAIGSLSIPSISK